MGLRLEIVLFVMIVMTVWVTTMVKITNETNEDKQMLKELEFVNTTFTEVDMKTLKARLFSTKGIRDTGVLTLEKLNYHSNSINQLVANKGTYKGDVLFLDGDVKLKEKEGFVYMTQHANYNQKSQILNITSSFVANRDKNIFHGDTLQYHAIDKKVNATKVDAIVYTVKK